MRFQNFNIISSEIKILASHLADKKNILLFVIAAITTSVCYAGIASSLQEGSYENNIYLSHNQYMVTYAGASNTDMVGLFDPWYPTADTTTGTFSYALIDNENGAYVINRSTGMITVGDNSKLTAGYDTLIVRTTLQGKTQDNYVWVRVKATSDCTFIDPSATSNGNGTRNSPYNTWEVVKIVKGKAYFQKRGTLNNFSIHFGANGTAGNEIIFGSYGTGERAEISTNFSSSGIGFAGSYVQFYELAFSGNMYGIQTETGDDNFAHTNCLFSDLTFHDNLENGQLYLKRFGIVGENNFYHKVFDVVAYDGRKYGMKIEGSHNTIENFRAYGNYKQGISIPVWGDYNTLKGISSYNNTINGLEISGRNHEVSYSYFKGNYRAIVVDDPSSGGSRIHHCLMEGGTGDASIKLRASGIYWEDETERSFGRDIIIEDNVIRNNYYAAGISIEYAMKNTTIRRNKIYNNYLGIKIGYGNNYIDTVKIHYNVFYDNALYDVYGMEGNHLFIYNNTSNGEINCPGSNNNVARNNFYKSMAGNYTSSNNLDIDAIPTGTYFTSYSNRDFRLKSTAALAINTGYALSLSPDIAGTIVPYGAGVDIGAYEYVGLYYDNLPSAPSNLTASATSPSTVSLAWTDNSNNEFGFELERSLKSSGNFSVVSYPGVNIVQQTDTKLQPSTVYYYRIRAYNNKGYTAYSNTITVTTPQPPVPETPQNLTYTAVRTNQITLKWTDASSYETGFKIYHKAANVASYSQISIAANTTQYILTGLSPASSYLIKVSAYNGTGESVFSNEISVMTTALQVPNTPSQLTGYAITKSSVGLNWTDNATDETGTYIERSLSISSDYTVIDTLSANIVKFSDKGLSSGTIYYYRVRAYNSEGVSNYSNVFEIRTPDLLPPNAPTHLIYTSVYKHALTLNWTDNALNETGLYVERYASSLGFVPIDTLPANTVTFSDHGLTGGKTYFYRLRAFNGDGPSAYSNIAEVKTLTLNFPDPPYNLRADMVSKSGIFLKWDDDNINEDGFELYRCDSAGAYFKLADLDSTATGYKDQSFKSGWHYQYKIRAHNQDGFSSFSDSIDILTPALNLPNPPSDFKTKNITYEKVVFTWKDNSDNESGFIIEKMNADDSFQEIMILPNTTTFEDNGLSENLIYIYRIKAYNDDGASYANGSVQVNTPKLYAPKAPSELSALNYTSTSITVRWQDNSDNETGFLIDRYPACDPDDITEIRVPENDTSYNDINLVPNTSYMYGIHAVNKAGSSSDLMRLFTTLSVAETGRIKDSLIAYYNFTRNPENIVRDLSNYGTPLDLHIDNDNAVTWDEDHKLTIMGNTVIQSGNPARKIIEACKRTNAFSVELWCKPLDSYNVLESYLLAIDKNESDRAFLMAQQFSNFKNTWDYSYVTGLQTVSTGTTGLPYLNLSEEISYINLNHIVYSIDETGHEKIYMNGVKSAEGYRPGGFDSWGNSYFLRLGNNENLTYTWYGTFYLLAIYNKALSVENIMTNYNAGPMDSIKMNILDYTINVFPNPADDRVNIELIPSKDSDINEKTTLKIVDLNGTIRYEEVVFNPSRYCLRTIPVSNLSKGIYLVQVTNGYSYQSSLFIVN